jgi:hypothetical protein
MMNIERSQLEQVLRQHGSDRTAQKVHEGLPESIDTERDRQLLTQCGIDANVLETLMASTDT